MPFEQILQHFHFLRPWWGLLLLPTVLVLLLQWRQPEQNLAWRAIIAPHLLQALRIRQFQNHWFNPSTAGALFMLLLTLVIMGPSWRQQPSPLTRDEAALVILLDVSESMGQSDIQPSRLERAKQKIADLLELRRGSRSALVVFAGSAHTVLDLTSDTQILSQYLSAIDKRIMPRSGKFAEYSLDRVDRIVGDSRAPTTVLLVTDGVSSETENAFGAWLDQRPFQLLVWGIGSTTVAEDSQLAPLEERALRNLADASGGRYIPLSIDKTDVRLIHRRVNAWYTVTEDSAVPWLDSGYWLVFPCLALFSLWFRRGWTLQWSLAGLLLLGSLQPGTAHADNNWFADLWLTPDQQGRLLLQRGDYREAAVRFENPMWKGMAYYYAEEFKLAAEYFSRVDSRDGRFNRANALAHRQDYVLAVRLYDEILAEEPGFEPARKNRAIVQDVIDAINNMSESQRDEPGAEGGAKELAEDDPLRAEGAEREAIRQGELEQFDASDILQDEKINAMWMRAVQRDPSHFLAVKFSMQLEDREDRP